MGKCASFILRGSSASPRVLTQTKPEKFAYAAPADPKKYTRPLWVDQAIYLFFLIIALAIPFSTKIAVNAFRVAVALWLLKLFVYRPKIRPQPLLLALLLFMALTAVASSLSPEPALSWGRMRTVSLLMLVPLVMQTLTSIRQARGLVIALVFSTLVAVAYTGWQYTFGIGVSLEQIKPVSPLAQAGLLPNDVITRVDGKRVYAPSTLRNIVEQGPPDQILKISMRRNAPPETYDLKFERSALRDSGLAAPDALGRGRPVRAQGFFKHYIPFSELLTLVAALAFGLALNSKRRRSRWLMGLVFLAIIGTLIATVTRATLAALVVACVAVFWIRARWKQRLASLSVFVVLFVLGSIWFQHTRGWGWFDPTDYSSQYRQLMWTDGVRLASQNPWFGVGMDSIYRHWQDWNIQAYRQFPHLKSHFHSSYVQIAAENGLPALLTWLAILALMAKQLARYARNGTPRAPHGIVIGALAALIAFCLASILHYTIGDAEFMIAFWLVAGIGLAVSELVESDGSGRAENTEVRL